MKVEILEFDAFTQQQPHNVHVSASAGKADGGRATRIRAVRVCAPPDEQLHDVGVACLCGGSQEAVEEDLVLHACANTVSACGAVVHAQSSRSSMYWNDSILPTKQDVWGVVKSSRVNALRRRRQHNFTEHGGSS